MLQSMWASIGLTMKMLRIGRAMGEAALPNLFSMHVNFCLFAVIPRSHQSKFNINGTLALIIANFI